MKITVEFTHEDMADALRGALAQKGMTYVSHEIVDDGVVVAQAEPGLPPAAARPPAYDEARPSRWAQGAREARIDSDGTAEPAQAPAEPVPRVPIVDTTPVDAPPKPAPKPNPRLSLTDLHRHGENDTPTAVEAPTAQPQTPKQRAAPPVTEDPAADEELRRVLRDLEALPTEPPKG